jgi:hypothetical protein
VAASSGSHDGDSAFYVARELFIATFILNALKII